MHGVIHGCMVICKGVWLCIEVYGEVYRCMLLEMGVCLEVVRCRGAWCWMVMHGVV